MSDLEFKKMSDDFVDYLVVFESDIKKPILILKKQQIKELNEEWNKE